MTSGGADGSTLAVAGLPVVDPGFGPGAAGFPHSFGRRVACESSGVADRTLGFRVQSQMDPPVCRLSRSRTTSTLPWCGNGARYRSATYVHLVSGSGQRLLVHVKAPALEVVSGTHGHVVTATFRRPPLTACACITLTADAHCLARPRRQGDRRAATLTAQPTRIADGDCNFNFTQISICNVNFDSFTPGLKSGCARCA